MYTDISKSWKYVEYAAPDEANPPADAAVVDLPVDLLRYRSRDYNSAMGEYGSYYSAAVATFYKTLPQLNKSEWILLEIEGVCQQADVYLNGILVGHIEGGGKHFVDITRGYVYSARNTVKICVWAPQMAGRYVGAGISGGVRLRTHADTVAIRDDGVYAVSEISGGKANVNIRAEITDKLSEFATGRKTYSVEAVIFNARGKKVARKSKKIRLRNTAVNLCEIPFRLARYYPWTPEDPYTYGVKVTLKDSAGKTLDEQDSIFGIVTRAVTPSRGLVLCGKGVKLKGAVVCHDNGILGMESVRSAEEFKLSRIKNIGYNAVRYIGCPSEAALDTLDKIGLMAVVDIFGVWSQGKYPGDGHVGFAERWVSDCDRIVCQLRKHPSVVIYGLCDDASEVYGRGMGVRLTKAISAAVRSLDPSRPVYVGSRELVPVAEELENAGLKSTRATDTAVAVSMGREKNLFGSLTAPSFACADIAGYHYLYPRYAGDCNDYPDRLILGCAQYPARAFEAFDECERSQRVIGEFIDSAADYLGEPVGKPAHEEDSNRLIPPHASFCGDLDLIYNRKPRAELRSIMLGDRSKSAIAVCDPESTQLPDKTGNTLKETFGVWNWPHSLGKTVDIEVYSGGEVVALYRDGKLIGRKLAGRGNKHVATFRTEYYPGKLEAVGFHKGRECSRVTLESVTSPRAVKLGCERKAGQAGDLLFVEISVTDKEGRVVPYASREVEISVEGSGELYALGSADRYSQVKTGGENVCPVYDGKALAVIKLSGEGDGKITVKATSDGLLSGKINLRVK